MRLDHGVNFPHQTNGFLQRHDDFLVVLGVIPGEFAPFAIFQPLFQDLIAADVELPRIAGHALKVLSAIDADALSGVDVSNLLNHIASPLGKGGYQLVEFGRLHHVKRHEFGALFCEGG